MPPSEPRTPPRPPDASPRGLAGALLLAAAAFGLLFLHSLGTPDMKDFWLAFYPPMNATGLVAGYRNTALDYPPVAHALILYGGRLGEACGGVPLTGIKVFLLGFAALSAAVFRGLWRGGLPLYLLTAQVLVSGCMLGYLDVFYTPTLLFALWALGRRRIVLFSALMAATCFIKWQPLILAPFCAWHALRPAGAQPQDGLAWNLSRTARLVLPALAVILACLAVYGKPVVEAFQAALVDTFLSGKAFNVNWAATYVLQLWHPGTVPPLQDGAATIIDAPMLGSWLLVPKALFAGMYLATLWRFHRGPNTLREFLRAALLGFLTYCMFNTGVHENHFFIAAVLACALVAVDPGAAPQAVYVTALSLLNLVLFYGFMGIAPQADYVVGVDMSVVCSAVFSGLYLWWWVGWWREAAPAPGDRPLRPPNPQLPARS